jgi:hypothetical protein
MARKNQCHGTTKKGTRCTKNIASGNRRYCNYHSSVSKPKPKQVLKRKATTRQEEIKKAADMNIRIQERIRQKPGMYNLEIANMLIANAYDAAQATGYARPVDQDLLRTRIERHARIHPKILIKKSIKPWSQRSPEHQWTITPPSMWERARLLKSKVDARMREEGWRHPYNWRRHRSRRNPRRRNTSPLRALEIYRPRRTITIRCQAPGCGKPTRKGKPYCVDHIEKGRYAQRIQAIEKRMDTELDQVNARGVKAININSPFVKTALDTLNIEDGLNSQNFAFQTGIPYNLVDHYIDFMQKHHFIDVRGKKIYLGDVELGVADRSLTSTDIAKELGVKVGTVTSWLPKGVPHIRIKGKSYFNLDEIIEWKAARKRQMSETFREERKKLRGKINFKPLVESFWADLEEDYHKGLPLQDLRVKYKVGLRRLNRFIEEKGLSRVVHSTAPKPFIEPFWEDLKKDYIAKMRVDTLMKKYNVALPRIHRYLDQEGVTREDIRRKTFSEPFWKDIKQEYIEGVKLRTIRETYHVSEPLLHRFIEQEGLPSPKERLQQKGSHTQDYWDNLSLDYQSGMSLASILKKYKIGKRRVKKFVAEEGLKRPGASRFY